MLSRPLPKEERVSLPGFDHEITCSDGKIAMAHGLILYLNSRTYEEMYKDQAKIPPKNSWPFTLDLVEEALTWIYHFVNRKRGRTESDEVEEESCGCGAQIPYRLYPVFDFLGAEYYLQLNDYGGGDIPCTSITCGQSDDGIKDMLKWLNTSHEDVDLKLATAIDDACVDHISRYFIDWMDGSVYSTVFENPNCSMPTPLFGKLVKSVFEKVYQLKDSFDYCFDSGRKSGSYARIIFDMCDDFSETTFKERILPHLPTLELDYNETTAKFGLSNNLHGRVMREIRLKTLGVSKYDFHVSFEGRDGRATIEISHLGNGEYTMFLNEDETAALKEYMKLPTSVMNIVWDDDGIPARVGEDGKLVRIRINSRGSH